MPDQAKAFAASQTRENLMRAFAGESQARSRYTIAAGIAHKSGLAVIQGLFLFTAEQEKTHAKQFYRQLHDLSGQTVRVDGTYPVDLYTDLLEQEQLFVSDVKEAWMCLHCGYVVDATVAPANCPVCRHPQGYFIRAELTPFRGGSIR